MTGQPLFPPRAPGARKPGSADDSLWYKDAIIYELHVRTFHDANQDGIGDFRGLIQKLDYLSELGVTCLWLLPFFPSPLRDDGYDIADYCAVHESYGTLADFREFLDAAHERGMQVLIELVINHTSDQHPWFQAARRAPPGSPERDYYVWSDSDAKYPGVRIIFTDTEKSNWTWDPEAKAYYWHRFFSHQPDLNFDNPVVVAEVVRIMRFWLDLGVDALRLDAIPYLVERDGTNCENLDETHAVIKHLRRELDAQHANRMILAEANQGPADVRAYFGDGDECHMAFHFPLMPRLFMGLRLEDRHPVVEILRQTPPVPETCQWALFLRNHDELTLEMVTTEERDYMYFAYSVDPRMRVNVGIRRRLAPLMENNRRRIELLNSILLSFPGTPIIYYGDEIGMGDNIYLGDRNGVRTPMQWSADRNAGFSRANPAKLYSPVIMDPIFGYEAVNVEAQHEDASSMLNWTRRMIALRKLFKVFGRGSIEFLEPANRKILAYVRVHQDERILCVANLSRFAQPVELDLSSFAGTTPVEMLGYVEFPRVGRTPYPLTLAPYGFLWFELHGEPEPLVPGAAPTAEVARVKLAATAAWHAPFQPAGQSLLQSLQIPAYLVRQRWFGGKSGTITAASVDDWIGLSDSLGVALLRVEYSGRDAETYVLILGFSTGAAAERLRQDHPASVLCEVALGDLTGVIHDALVVEEHCRALLSLIVEPGRRPGVNGALSGAASPDAELDATKAAALTVQRAGGEQSNSSLILGDRFILKLFRRLEFGPNPDYEMVRFLSERRRFDGVPPYAGHVTYRRPVAGTATLAFMQRLVESQGDGWVWMQEELARYFERVLTFPSDELLAFADRGSMITLADSDFPPGLDEALGVSDDAAASLGRRTAQMHHALSQPDDDPAFGPEPFSGDDLEKIVARVRVDAASVFERLKDAVPDLPDDVVESASQVLSMRSRIWQRLGKLDDGIAGGVRIRIHGDYHLGQVLRVANDFVIIDFEGEPSRTLGQRREKQSAMKDVAGMLRSFNYAARVGLMTHLARRGGNEEKMQLWARLWERSVQAAFLRAYRHAISGSACVPQGATEFARLLELFMLDKALYELRYELDNRPAWVRIPLGGIIELEHDRELTPEALPSVSR
jgi:maltose alpha-D-glucosyltransferase/alpha-amylase